MITRRNGARRPLAALAADLVAFTVAAVVLADAAQARQAAPPPPATPPTTADAPPEVPAIADAGEVPPLLADAPKAERLAIDRLLAGGSWVKRAIVAVRMERYACDESRSVLERLRTDGDWHVRAYAVRSLAVRGVAPPPEWLAEEGEPRVLRTALRCGWPMDLERLGRGVQALAGSSSFDAKMLAVELAAASGDDALRETARETTRTVILRMGRAEAGSLSGRLACITGQNGLHRPWEWQNWAIKTGRTFIVRSGALIEKDGPAPPPARIALLEPERFAALDAYIEQLGARDVDLAICLDCTASMSGELAAAQSGVDDLVAYVASIVRSLRFGIVGYRDRRDRFKTRAWDFTSDVAEARQRLWQLTAAGGGDRREAVYDAMKLAYESMTWMPDHTKVLVVVGDAPPHAGFGTQCVQMARRAQAAGLVTHAIEAEGKEVERFREIAEAGGGRCVALHDDGLLTAEIAGLTLGETFGEEFREFFRLFLDLCR